ncbi:response regulator transcription factor [Parasphaerochaeta coccoides]|uniref:Two component transcriptional regulator, LuxR family n=1 Tax=Parasphaerochaeta coccoides (strain ATCC BAA-1237 / DSM 17374 / SPN1) TaxID=760011 RepID=F4GLI1_PARC1|nr:response regulator transcription factor [Parasphaerochaeta coccoides]AEC01951.1 two component transcriptional regulator, LuxR family [Parasphaerochaeta coccoides DSM 17374]
MKKFIIVDDHPLYRKGVSLLIEQRLGLECVGESSTVAEATDMIAKTLPYLAIIDISLQNGSGLDLVSSARTSWPALKILVLSMHDENLYGERAVRSGAKGYVMKHETPERLIDAITDVLAGRLAISDNLRNRLVENISSGLRSSIDPRIALTNRELEIFSLIGKGYGASDIATRLNLSVKTINAHQDRMKNRLGLLTAGELRRLAFDWIAGNI